MKRSELKQIIREELSNKLIDREKFKIIKDRVQIKVPNADKTISYYKLMGRIKKIDDKTVEVNVRDLVSYAIGKLPLFAGF